MATSQNVIDATTNLVTKADAFIAKARTSVATLTSLATAAQQAAAAAAASAAAAAASAGTGTGTTPTTPTNTTVPWDVISFSGDSITEGGGNNPNPYPKQLQALVGSAVTIKNYGYSATTLLQMKDNWGRSDYPGPNFVAGKRNLVILGPAGTNDLTQYNATLDVLKDLLRQFFADKAKVSGSGYQKAFDSTLIPRKVEGDYTQAMEDKRIAFNAHKRANWASYCDGLVDFDAMVTVSDLYDGIHPGDDPGAKKMAAGLYSFLLGTTSSPAPSPSPSPSPAPAPATSTAMAKIKAAVAAAPASYAAIPKSNIITVTQAPTGSNPTAIPGANGAFTRHYFSRNTFQNAQASNGNPDLLTAAKVPYPELIGPAFDGQANFTISDGSSSTQYYWTNDISDISIGFTHTGRALAFASRFGGKDSTLWVDGVLQPALTHSNEDSYCYVDFGTVATRNIIFYSGAIEFAEIAHKPGDTFVPYDFTANKLRYNAMHDSWGQRRDFGRTELRMPNIMGHLLGAATVGGSVIGGTGYSQGSPNATAPARRALLNEGSPDIIDVCMIVNDHPDNNPTFAADVATVLSRARTDNPGKLLIATVWCSTGGGATNTSGTEYRKRTIIKNALAQQAAPWIFLDGFEGRWNTSSNTSKATADGPWITGEGTVASPTGSGNADTWIDEPGGRHPTPVGTTGLCNFKASYIKAALATM